MGCKISLLLKEKIYCDNNDKNNIKNTKEITFQEYKKKFAYMPKNDKYRLNMDYNHDTWDWGRIIGKGKYGEVHVVKHKVKQTYHVIKLIPKAMLVLRNSHKRMQNEIQALRYLNHPLIGYCFGAWQDPIKICLVLEYIPGGDLMSYLEHKKERNLDININDVIFYISEIGYVLNYIHSLGLVYRDIKPENIMIGIDGHIKLVDFGFIEIRYSFLNQIKDNNNTIKQKIENENLKLPIKYPKYPSDNKEEKKGLDELINNNNEMKEDMNINNNNNNIEIIKNENKIKNEKEKEKEKETPLGIIPLEPNAVGTISYLAPELADCVLNKKKIEPSFIDSPLDWFALGCLIYKLYTNLEPFGNVDILSKNEILYNIIHLNINWDLIKNMELKDLILHLINPIISERFGWNEFSNHILFNLISWENIELGKNTAPYIPKRVNFDDDEYINHINSKNAAIGSKTLPLPRDIVRLVLRNVPFPPNEKTLSGDIKDMQGEDVITKKKYKKSIYATERYQRRTIGAAEGASISAKFGKKAFESPR